MHYSSPAQTPCSDSLLVENRPARRRGATAMEYLFVISLILIVAMSAIGSFGQSTKNTAQKAGNAIQQATSGR